MFRFFIRDACPSEPAAPKFPWKQEEDFFAEELPRASKAIQALYADHVSPMPSVFPPAVDLDGNWIERRPHGGHGYMLDLAAWHRMGYDLYTRFYELEAAYAPWQAQLRPSLCFVVTYLWPYLPFLRTLYLRRHHATVRRLQAVELLNQVAVLKALLELERKKGSGSGGGGKRKRSALPPRMPSHTAPASLSLH